MPVEDSDYGRGDVEDAILNTYVDNTEFHGDTGSEQSESIQVCSIYVLFKHHTYWFTLLAQLTF